MDEEEEETAMFNHMINQKDATFNYSPNKRVLADIDKKKWIMEKSVDSLKLVKGKLIRDFKVNFSRSDVEGYAKDVQRYTIQIMSGKFR